MPMTDTQGQILDAVLTVIVRQGIRSLSFRAVAAEADVALGLLNYHFDDKESLIRAAYQHAAQRLMESSRTAATGTGSRDQAVRSFIRGVFGQEFLDADYLALRLSLWSVARSEPTVAAINAEIYETYLAELSALIAAARPELEGVHSLRRASDVMTIQLGLWVAWTLRHDDEALERCLKRCESIALDDDMPETSK